MQQVLEKPGQRMALRPEIPSVQIAPLLGRPGGADDGNTGRRTLRSQIMATTKKKTKKVKTGVKRSTKKKGAKKAKPSTKKRVGKKTKA
jgi:hypothetical protein